MKSKKELSPDDFGKLLGLSAIVFGSIFRLFPVLLAGFPINDGGLFYSLTRAIQQNGFKLPDYVAYNGLDIPFAYPPLGFYVAAVIETWFQVPLLEVYRWLPAVVLIGSLISFYFLAKQFLKSVEKAGFATLVFALIPRSIAWTIMGGGVTRSFGQLFFILTVYFTLRLFEERSWKMVRFIILFGTLVVLSHPEATIHTVAACLLLLGFNGRNRKSVLHAFFSAFGVVLLSAAWWLPSIQRYGLEPYLSAGQTGLHNTFGSLYFLTSFSEEPAITFAMVLAFIGIAAGIIKKDYLLTTFFILPFFVEPRNAANTSVIPLSLLAANGFYDVIVPGLKNKYGNVRVVPVRGIYVFIVFIGIYLATGILYYGTQISTERVTQQNFTAFEWLKANTPTDSRFIVVTGELDVFRDWTQEWFPTLTGRISQTTIQGQEWLIGEDFLPRINIFQEIQLCLTSTNSLDCIESLATGYNIPYDYIYISVKSLESPTLSVTTSGNNLIYELKDSGRYKLIYQVEDIAIFEFEN